MTLTEQDVNDKYCEKVATKSVWIDKAFLEEILGNGAKVESHDVKAAVGVGDNYLSILYRTIVNYREKDSDELKTEYLMVKGYPTAPILLDMIEDLGVFEKEISIYNRCLPAMFRILKQYFPEGSVMVAPKAYTCSRSDTVVMEDLAQDGYKMANRRQQLDYEHSLVTIRTLARFHALSIKVLKDEPELLSSISSEFFNEQHREKMAPFMEQMVGVVGTEMKTCEGREKYGEVIEDLKDYIWDKMMEMVRPTSTFNVLNHGDMWVNNMMFKYDPSGKVQSAKLVDFQLSRYTTPAVDLLYFFFTSIRPAVLKAHMFDLIDEYYKAFKSDVATLGLDVNFPISQLHEDIKDRVSFGISTMCQILPMLLTAPQDAVDIDSMTLEDVKKPIEESPVNNCLRTTLFKDTAGGYMEHLDSIGYLDSIKDRWQPLVDSLKAKAESKEIVDEE